MPQRLVKSFSKFVLIPAALALSGCAADPAAKMLPTGWQQLQAGQADLALITAQNALTEAPHSPHAAEALYLKGRAYEAKLSSTPLDQRKNLSAAAAAYTAALNEKPAPALAGKIYSGLANTCYWQDDYSNAWRNWVKAYDLTAEPATKGYILYRIGLCQQRLGRFEDADKTLAAVVQQYPQSDAANRAQQKLGARAFGVQVATFASSQTAEGAMNTLRREGYIPLKAGNAQGQTVVTLQPFNTFVQAQSAKLRLAGMFPDAVVFP